MGKIIAISNQKGGVCKTTSTFNIAAGLAIEGKKVLVVDLDPQGNLTTAMGFMSEEMENTTADLMNILIKNNPIEKQAVCDCIVKAGNIYLLPTNISLSVVDLTIVQATAREYIVHRILSLIRDDFDYILIDSGPSLSMLPINALTAADSVLVPIGAQFLESMGFNLLRNTISMVQNLTNPNLKIEGVFLTKYDGKLLLAKQVLNSVNDICLNEGINLFSTQISSSTNAATASLKGQSIFEYMPKCKTAKEYRALVKEILGNEQ